MGETAPFWRFSAASYPDLEVAIPSNFRQNTDARAIDQNPEESSGVRNHNCDLTMIYI
jgi:acetolactate synthase-1/3 small subunit